MLPTFSIIIPTSNTEGIVDSCLKSLLNLNYSKEKFEVILIGDKEDQLTSLAEKYDGELDLKVRSAPFKPGAKRNLGVREAKGDIIAFCDDDVSVEPNWLNKLAKHFSDSNVAIVGGPNFTPLTASLRERCSGYILSSFLGGAWMAARYRQKIVLEGTNNFDIIISCNMAARKFLFTKGNYFPEDIWPNEENIFCFQVQQAGHMILYDPNLIVWHRRRPIFIPHLKQIYGYGRGRAQMISRVPKSLNIIHLMPSIFLISLIIGALLSIFNTTLRTLYFAGLSIYLIAALSSSTNICLKKHDPKAFLLLVPTFFLHHITYGLGFLKGLLKKKEKPRRQRLITKNELMLTRK